jgi:putative restriction endonuclease
MDRIAAHLPSRYAPLRPNGDGLQNVYLTQVQDSLAAVLVDLIGREARDLLDMVRGSTSDGSAPALGLVEWEEHELQRVSSDATLPETDRLAIVTARRGQGLFKQNVMRIERFCRITRLIASSTCVRVTANPGETRATKNVWMARTACC